MVGIFSFLLSFISKTLKVTDFIRRDAYEKKLKYRLNAEYDYLIIPSS